MNATVTKQTAADVAREKFLKERHTGIGGSDIAAIMGFSPFKTPVDVWLEKTGQTPDEPPSLSMEIGTNLEKMVADLYERETGRGVVNFSRMLRSGVRIGHFDRLVIPEGEKIAALKGEIRTDTLLECKTSSNAAAWESGVPPYYESQVQHYMGLSDKLERADVAVLFLINKKFKTFTVKRDQKTIDEMALFAEEWWAQYVVGNTPPPASCENDARLLWRKSNGLAIDISKVPENIALVIRYLRAEAEKRKHAEEREGALRAQIMEFMKEAEAIVKDDKPVVVWSKPRMRRVIDWEAAARNAGVTDEIVAESFSSEKETARVFRLR